MGKQPKQPQGVVFLEELQSCLVMKRIKDNPRKLNYQAPRLHLLFDFPHTLYYTTVSDFAENIEFWYITGRPKSVIVSFQSFGFVSSGYWCFVENVKDCYMKLADQNASRTLQCKKTLFHMHISFTGSWVLSMKLLLEPLFFLFFKQIFLFCPIFLI